MGMAKKCQKYVKRKKTTKEAVTVWITIQKHEIIHSSRQDLIPPLKGGRGMLLHNLRGAPRFTGLETKLSEPRSTRRARRARSLNTNINFVSSVPFVVDLKIHRHSDLLLDAIF